MRSRDPELRPPTGGAPAPAPEGAPGATAFPVAWSAFLLVATAMTVFRAGSPAGLPVSAARTPARDLFAVMALGVTLLWPMLRLCERAPRDRRARAARALGDSLVVAAPALTVVLASQIVVGWGWLATGAVSLLYTGWTLLVGALLAIGAGARTGATRAGWMALIACLALGAPALTIVADARGRDRAFLLASPVTAPGAITASASGAPVSPGADAWLAGAIPAALAVPLWALAFAGLPRRDGVHLP